MGKHRSGVGEGRGASVQSPGVLVLETALCLSVNGDAVLKIYFQDQVGVVKRER